MKHDILITNLPFHSLIRRKKANGFWKGTLPCTSSRTMSGGDSVRTTVNSWLYEYSREVEYYDPFIVVISFKLDQRIGLGLSFGSVHDKQSVV